MLPAAEKRTLSNGWLITQTTQRRFTRQQSDSRTSLNLEITKPVNTALLLPLSGKFAKQAQLIRDGFILTNDE